MALAINAARAHATVGEISDALEKVYGRHQAEIRTIAGVYRDEVGKAEQCGYRNGSGGEVRRRGRPPPAHPGRQDGAGRPRPRPEGDRAPAFADIGFDVDVGSLFSTPDEVARQAADNDVHVVGVSSLAAGHLDAGARRCARRAGRGGPPRHHGRRRRCRSRRVTSTSSTHGRRDRHLPAGHRDRRCRRSACCEQARRPTRLRP